MQFTNYMTRNIVSLICIVVP